mmetsp:Transcript_3056/g.7649  ORF Transcript_3056/g.7649 Transcript_3056/m.7649 type:complete len:381 (-) Transcript_3056:103-1245(-)
MIDHARTALKLWVLGLCEALSVSRVLIRVILDDSGALWHKLGQCCLINLAIFAGSVGLWQYGLQPGVHYLLTTFLAPVSGPVWCGWLEAALHWLYRLAWLVPTYFITFMVNCGWYADLAKQAGRAQAVLGSATAPNGAAYGSAAGSHASTGGAPTDAMSQEIYLGIMLGVLSAQVYAAVAAAAYLPLIGAPASAALNAGCSAWLWAYYAYDYAWAARGASLAQRISFFQGAAFFFAGFGTPMAVVTVALSFYYRAAIMAVLFPLYVLHAFESDPVRVVAGAVRQAALYAPAAAKGSEEKAVEGRADEGASSHQQQQHQDSQKQQLQYSLQPGLPPAVPAGAPAGAPGIPLFHTVLPATNFIANKLVARFLDRSLGKAKQG